MDYMDEYLNTFENDFDDDFEDYDWEEGDDFFAYDYSDLAQRNPNPFRPIDEDHRHGQGHRPPHHYRPIGTRRRLCCVYRHRRTGRLTKVCQNSGTRCASRLGRDWILVNSYSVDNCRRCR
jgi:hypothetical protein